MRAVARAADTTTPTVYERYRDRSDILRALRLQTRAQLFAALSRTRDLLQACRRQLQFALDNPHAYEMLFDGVGQPPSLHEPWPSFNLFRRRLIERLGGTSRQHNRLMLALWCLMHGTALLIIRGRFEGELRKQTLNACEDAFEAIIAASERAGRSGRPQTRWPSQLILGEDHAGHENPPFRSGRQKGRRGKRGRR